ncbi:MAG: hypothetical protein KKH04_13265 [Proteobacteria bacterium]|nr:hypothetical protein [Pseudomonadota bacterium]
MPRRARLDAPGTLHHVMIRGIEGKGIFRDTQDRKDSVTRLEDLSEQTSTRILAWPLLGRVRAMIAWILSRVEMGSMEMGSDFVISLFSLRPSTRSFSNNYMIKCPGM